MGYPATAWKRFGKSSLLGGVSLKCSGHTDKAGKLLVDETNWNQLLSRMPEKASRYWRNHAENRT